MLTGVARGVGLGSLLSIALPPPEDRSLADVWSALGGELKPSLDLVISAPFDTARVAARGSARGREPPHVDMAFLEGDACRGGADDRPVAWLMHLDPAGIGP